MRLLYSAISSIMIAVLVNMIDLPYFGQLIWLDSLTAAAIGQAGLLAIGVVSAYAYVFIAFIRANGTLKYQSVYVAVARYGLFHCLGIVVTLLPLVVTYIDSDPLYALLVC